MMRHGRPHTPDHADDPDEVERDAGPWIWIAICCGVIAALWWWR